MKPSSTAWAMLSACALACSSEEEKTTLSPPPVPPPTAATPTISVVNVSGSVEARLGGAPWQPLRAGTGVGLRDEIRTRTGGQAILGFDATSRVTLTADTEVSVVEVAEVVRELEIKSGRVSVDHDARGARLLRIRDAQSDAVLESTGGRFDVARQGETFAVATEQGKVTLTAQGKAVEVGAGRQSMAIRGSAPQEATAIPTDLLLDVARQGHGRDPCATIEGAASPGSHVSAGDVTTAVGGDGRFALSPARDPRRRSLEVIIRDIQGREKRTTIACGVSTTAPPRESAVRDLRIQWGTPRKSQP